MSADYQQGGRVEIDKIGVSWYMVYSLQFLDLLRIL